MNPTTSGCIPYVLFPLLSEPPSCIFFSCNSVFISLSFNRALPYSLLVESRGAYTLWRIVFRSFSFSLVGGGAGGFGICFWRRNFELTFFEGCRFGRTLSLSGCYHMTFEYTLVLSFYSIQKDSVFNFYILSSVYRLHYHQSNLCLCTTLYNFKTYKSETAKETEQI